MKEYTNEQVNEWYDYYKICKSTRNVAKKFNISRPTIKRRFKNAGLKLGVNRKYFFNEDFFLQDTPESYYWAGFIAADGCILEGKTNGKSVVICLSIKDNEHLKKFANTINFSGDIKIYDQRPIRNSTTAVLSLHSTKMSNSLERFNITSRKTATYTVPEWLCGHSLINHFLRGYSDGDGSFCITTPRTINSTGQLCYNICGTKLFLENIRRIFAENCKTNSNLLIQEGKGIHNLLYNGRINVAKVRDFLYSNSNIMIELERKKRIAYNMVWEKRPRSYKSIGIISTNLIGEDIKYYSSQTDAIKDGFNARRISECINGKKTQYKERLFRKATESENILWSNK